MRMRRRNNLEPRMNACESVWIHEPEALRGNWRSLMPGCREHGFLGMGGRVGRERGHGPEQRGTDELRRAFGPHVHAEIQQGRRIASGCSRHAQQVAAVGFGFHNGFLFLRLPGRFPSGVLFRGCRDGSPLLRAEAAAGSGHQIGMPLSINSASRMQAAQVSGSVRVVSTAIWLGSGTWMERA